MKGYKKYIYKSLLVLGVFMVFGIQKAQAFVGLAIGAAALGAVLIPGTRNFLLDSVAEPLVEGLAGLINGVLSVLGGVAYFFATAAIDFAFQLNSLIAASPVVQEGFGLTQDIVNIGFVIGLIILAFALMLKADWLVDWRQALPRFIAALLLANLSFFILTSIIIQPVDNFTKNIYRAANFNAESFRGPFQPDINLEPAIATQIVMSGQNCDGNNECGGYMRHDPVNWFTFREQVLSPEIEAVLLVAEEKGYLLGVPPVYTNDEGPVYVTASQRAKVAEELVREAESWVYVCSAGSKWETLQRSDDESVPPTCSVLDNDESKELFFRARMEEQLDDAGAAYAQGDKEAILDDVVNEFKQLFALPPADEEITGDVAGFGWGCNDVVRSSDCATVGGGSGDDSRLVNVLHALRNPSGGVSIIIAVSEVLFNSIFLFIGAFSLFAVAILFIIRYVVLSIMIIIFPFMWIVWIFPKLSIGGANAWTKWWNEFIRWLVFGPVAAFFFFLAIRASLQIDNLTNTQNIVSGSGSMAIIAATIGNMIVTLGLLIGGIYSANKIGIRGAPMMMRGLSNSGKWASGKAKALAIKAGLAAGRYTNKKTLGSEKGQKMLGGLETAGASNPLTRALMAPIRVAGRKVDMASKKAQSKNVKNVEGKLPMDDPGKLAQMLPGLSGLQKAVAFEQLVKKDALGKIENLPQFLHDNRKVLKAEGKEKAWKDAVKKLGFGESSFTYLGDKGFQLSGPAEKAEFQKLLAGDRKDWGTADYKSVMPHFLGGNWSARHKDLEKWGFDEDAHKEISEASKTVALEQNARVYGNIKSKLTGQELIETQEFVKSRLETTKAEINTTLNATLSTLQEQAAQIYVQNDIDNGVITEAQRDEQVQNILSELQSDGQSISDLAEMTGLAEVQKVAEDAGKIQKIKAGKEIESVSSDDLISRGIVSEETMSAVRGVKDLDKVAKSLGVSIVADVEDTTAEKSEEGPGEEKPTS